MEKKWYTVFTILHIFSADPDTTQNINLFNATQYSLMCPIGN